MATPYSRIISIGSEITSGRILDTNARFLASELLKIGVPPRSFYTVADDPADILSAVKSALSDARLVVVTGGLGPTMDDYTRKCVADALGVSLVFDARSWKRICAFFKKIGRTPLDSEKLQAYYPKGAAVIDNPVGIAPGFLAKRGKRAVLALPGVPVEMASMFQLAIPKIKKMCPDREPRIIKLIHTCGMTESKTAETLAEVFKTPGLEFGITAKDIIITVSITGPVSKKKVVAVCVRRARKILGNAVFGLDEESLAGAIIKKMRNAGKKLAVAESCTGGNLSMLITAVPGASDVFLGSFVTYSNEMKIRGLGVSRSIIRKHGAVSEECASAMAVGAMKKTGADAAISTTGIAGPAGGSRLKPVGLVYFAAAARKGVIVKRRMFSGSRRDVQIRASNAALNNLRLSLENAWKW